MLIDIVLSRVVSWQPTIYGGWMADPLLRIDGVSFATTINDTQNLRIQLSESLTLLPREWRYGLIGTVKSAFDLQPSMLPPMLPRLRTMLDPHLALSPTHRDGLLQECLATTRAVIERDRYEKTGALALEYGYTIGHAVSPASVRRIDCAAVRSLVSACPSRATRRRHLPEGASEQAAVDVVMVTSGRRTSALAAIESVMAQTHDGPIGLLILEDRTDRAAGWSTSLRAPANISITHSTYNPAPSNADFAPIGRVSRLRNHALTLVRAPFIAFIDDDNLWDGEHLSSLVAALEHSNASAAHSWRKLIDSSGTEVVPDRFIWRHPNDGMSRQLYDIYQAAGVFSENEAIVRDRVTVPYNGKDYGLVDMGEWLFRRDLFDDIRFCEDFSLQEITEMVGEDDKLLAEIRNRGVATVCTQRATLKYRLGGFSNAWN